MANPNLTALASLYGKASYLAVTTSTQNLISNPLNSNQIFKINIISVTNTASYPVTVTLQTIRSNTIVEIASNITIPPQTSVKLNNKNNFMYLEEGDTVQLYANANSAIQAVASYEILSSVLPGSPGTTYSFNYLSSYMVEGIRYTIIINTTGVSDGTTLYWTNSGNTVAADFTSSANSGSFVIRNNTGFFNIILTSDSTIETGETVIIQIRTGSTTGTIVATSSTIQVLDALAGIAAELPALNAAQIKAANPSATDGNYWYQPTGTSTPILCYTNFSNASTGKGFVLIARGRESLDWWNNAGQNTSALSSSNLNTNTPIAVASSDFVNGLIGSQWSGMRLLCNRINIPDSWLFTGVTNTTFSWSYWNQSPSSVSATSQRYTGLNMTGTLDLNHSSSTNFTDTNNLGGGGGCQRSFTWTWGSHGGYQGWSGGSSCNPTGNFQAGSEGHSLNLVNVYVEC